MQNYVFLPSQFAIPCSSFPGSHIFWICPQGYRAEASTCKVRAYRAHYDIQQGFTRLLHSKGGLKARNANKSKVICILHSRHHILHNWLLKCCFQWNCNINCFCQDNASAAMKRRYLPDFPQV